MRFALVFSLLVLVLGCEPRTRTVHGDPKDCGVYFDYAGNYSTTLERKQDGETTSVVLDITVQQNGPAVMVANVLAVADSEGMSFGHFYVGRDPWINGPVGEPFITSYSGASRAGEPFVLDLNIDVDYVNFDGLDYAIDYVITLGEKLDYLAE